MLRACLERARLLTPPGFPSVTRRPAVAAKSRTWTPIQAVGSQSSREGKGTSAAANPPAAAAPTIPAVTGRTTAAPPAPVLLTTSHADDLIRAVYSHMFGQAYLFAADRASLVPTESAFRCGVLTVKDLMRAVAKSPAYKARFFHKQTTYANIEALAGHLLGRSPHGVDEYRRWARVYDASGYEAMVNAMMDDGEYDDAFGDATVPYCRKHGLSVTGADAYRRAVTPAGIRLDDSAVEEGDGGAAAGLVVVGILVAAVIGYLLSTGSTH